MKAGVHNAYVYLVVASLDENSVRVTFRFDDGLKDLELFFGDCLFNLLKVLKVPSIRELVKVSVRVRLNDDGNIISIGHFHDPEWLNLKDY